MPNQELTETVLPFITEDGFECNLLHIQGDTSPSKGPVILVHGAGVRANIFRAPVETNLVDYLITAGYDVWLENWRGSIDLPPNQWTLDQVALYDHPAAVAKVIQETGAADVQAVIHCQGSTSFMMSIAAGLLPQVRTVVSNAVALHPVIPRMARAKMWALIKLAGAQFPYMNPQWGLHSPNFRSKLVSAWVKLTHHECNNPVCKHASFVYGIGFPTLWEHNNLDEATHDWLSGELAHVPRSFFQQMNQCVAEGQLVAVEGDARLPVRFADQPPKTDARFAFFAGELNRCFLPASQERTFEMFDSLQPGYHSLHLIPDYAHLDMFMGYNAAIDVFPLMLAELEKP